MIKNVNRKRFFFLFLCSVNIYIISNLYNTTDRRQSSTYCYVLGTYGPFSCTRGSVNVGAYCKNFAGEKILTRRLRIKLAPSFDSLPHVLFVVRVLDVRHNMLNLSHSQNHNYYFFLTDTRNVNNNYIILFCMRFERNKEYALTGFWSSTCPPPGVWSLWTLPRDRS